MQQFDWIKYVFKVALVGALVTAIYLLGYNVGSIKYSTESCKYYKDKVLTSPYYRSTIEE